MTIKSVAIYALDTLGAKFYRNKNALSNKWHVRGIAFSSYFLNVQKFLIVILIARLRPFTIRRGVNKFLGYWETAIVGVTKHILMSWRARFSKWKRNECFITVTMTEIESKYYHDYCFFLYLLKYQVPRLPFSV